MGIISYGVRNPGDGCLVTEEREENWDWRLCWVNDADKEVCGNAPSVDVGPCEFVSVAEFSLLSLIL